MEQLIKIAVQIQQQNKIIYLKNQQSWIAKGNICLVNEVSSIIDILWDSSKANIIITKSNNQLFKYLKSGVYQYLTKIEFRHAHICPYLKQDVNKSLKFYKPCSCVMIKNYNSEILITRRKLTLNSFPGAWVLPGGHLQKEQGIIQGGLRQAQQQIGLNKRQSEVILNQGVMAWQSAFYKQNKILSSAFVIFFPIKVKQLIVKPQQSQIQQYTWKNILDQKDQIKYQSQIKNGYGQAHLNYLSFYRKINYQIQQKKLWIKIKEVKQQ